MSEKINEIPASTFFIGAFITSAIGGVLLLALDFGWWDGSNYYLGVYIYGWIGAWNGLIGVPIIISGFLLLYCMAISILVLRFPEKIPDKKFVKYGFYAAVLEFILSIIGGIVFAAIMEYEDSWWWFGGGFYGGAIGGLLTAILFYLGEKVVEKVMEGNTVVFLDDYEYDYLDVHTLLLEKFEEFVDDILQDEELNINEVKELRKEYEIEDEETTEA